MRLTWKLALVISIGVGAQMLISRYADDIDEAGFTYRVFVIHLCGGTVADPGVLEMADRLHRRKMARADYAPARLNGPCLEDEFPDPPARVNASTGAN